MYVYVYVGVHVV